MRRWMLATLLAVAGTAFAQPGAKVVLDGYAEYLKDGRLVVEGQLVAADSRTRFEGRRIDNLYAVPLGWEVEVEGRRQTDGSVLASKIEAKPNGIAMFESEVLDATNQIERAWVDAGRMYDQAPNGREVTIGELQESGPEAERVQRITMKLAPPYVDAQNLRVRVVETDEWNASAMGNGAIWVYSGLIEEMSDDELAIILGHELAHYTHEHSRRGAKKGFWTRLAGLAGYIGAQAIDNDAARTGASLAALLGSTAFQSNYSRDMEDQADRVGLRYAHEAGYDVSKGPELWRKFREKYGESDSVQNFFFGSHSRPSDRIRNIEHELSLNYRDGGRQPD